VYGTLEHNIRAGPIAAGPNDVDDVDRSRVEHFGGTEKARSVATVRRRLDDEHILDANGSEREQDPDADWSSAEDDHRHACVHIPAHDAVI
jgi:hypothetical protein